MATYIPLQSVQLTANTANVVFSGIPQDYTDLILVFRGQVTSAVSLALQVNGDTATNYSITELAGDGSVATSSGNANVASMVISSNGAQIGTGTPWVSTLHFQDYKNTAKFKTVFMRTSAPGTITTANVGLWRSTAAINSIKIMGYADASGFTAGTTFDLYGIKSGSQKALGGDIVRTDGTYWYHSFTNSGTFTVQQDSSLTVDYLVVAGGGGGSSRDNTIEGAGGGGAGGYLTSTTALSPGSTHIVTVGAGGRGVGQSTGSNGTNSVFGNIVCIGGGGGSVGQGGSGGSGGGTGSGTPIGTGTSGQGNNGGAKGTQNNQFGAANSGGGGGGAGAVGQTPTTSAGGNGGAGLSSSITGSSVDRAGGGGGAGSSGGTASHGGGAGTVGPGGIQGTSGTASTGGGGGARNSNNSIVAQGGNGGSGIVVVRYAV